MKETMHVWRLDIHASDAHTDVAGYWYENGDREPLHRCGLQFTMRGSVHVRNGENHFVVPQGGAFLYYYGEDSAYGLAEDTEREYAAEWLMFSGAGLVEQWKLMNQEFGPIINPELGALVLKAAHRMSDNMQRGNSYEYNNATSELYRFVSELYDLREQGRDVLRKPVDKAIHRLLHNPCYPWSIKELVQELGCSREHFTRVFIERFQASPADWLNQQRLKQALYLLEQSNIPIQDVARQSGFSSTHTMARLIRQETALSPSAYREQL